MGKIYRGHPLILRIIIGEILNEPFSGNIQAYWNDERENVNQKIEEVEKDLIEAEEGLNLGAEDEWKLHKLTRKIRNDMYEKRLKITFDRLEKNVNDAYILICAASVYRSPEKEKFWIEHLIHWIYRLEKIECGQHRQEAARQELSNRFLIVESINDNGQRKLEQHSLIRSVSIEHRKQLTKNLQIM